MNSGTMPQTADDTQPEGDAEAQQLSAWLDGELSDEAADPILARLLHNDAMQRRFHDWHLVGDGLRSGEVLAGHSPRLCARINAALAAEPALLAPAALRPRFKRHLASGFAVAAAAAVLVFVAVPQLRGVPEAPALAGATPSAAGSLALGASGAVSPAVSTAASTAAPAALSVAASRPVRDPRLDPYLRAHRDFMGAGVMPAAAVYLRSGSEGER